MVDKSLVRKRRRDGIRQGYWVSSKKRRLNRKFRKKRIVIGGPPHSGKSTFMVLLERRLERMGVDVKLIDLDYASPTVEWLKGMEGDRKKQPWTPMLAQQAKSDFLETSKTTDVVLGDSPGKITDVTRTLTRGTDGAIILSRDDMESRKWKRFFRRTRIPIICVLDSDLFGKGWYSPKHNIGRVTNLSREKLRNKQLRKRNIAVDGASFEIAERFGLMLK